MDPVTLYQKALKLYGEDSQFMMLIEECGELLSAISKLKRRRIDIQELITELADVHIMVEQIAMIYGYGDFLNERYKKLKRLEERLNKDNETNGTN